MSRPHLEARPGHFWLTFDNGCTVSVTFRGGNYCENRDKQTADLSTVVSRDAELAAWRANGDWITLAGWTDSVEGWQTPNKVAAFISYVAGLES